MGVEEPMNAATLRNARDASSAHLEAVLKVNGASYLRLAHLRDLVGASDQVELKSDLGLSPKLWLDLAHCITMEPDAGTYRLSHHSADKIEVLLETEHVETMVAAARNVEAHRVVGLARMSGSAAQKADWRWMTLLYVWAMGLITGIAVLAVYVIAMNKLPF